MNPDEMLAEHCAEQLGAMARDMLDALTVDEATALFAHVNALGTGQETQIHEDKRMLIAMLAWLGIHAILGQDHALEQGEA